MGPCSYLDIVRMLSAAGADPNIEGTVFHNSRFTLTREMRAGSTEWLSKQRRNGAEVDARGEVLFKFRVSADIIPEGGEFGTVLRAASAGSKPQEVQKILIVYGADLPL